MAFADDNFEMVRKLCLFYNAKCCYENNKKGLYAYFSKMNCSHLLADTPEYLKDKDLVKITGIGNKSKGVNATAAINNYANTLIRDWLLKPTVHIETVVDEDGKSKDIPITEFNLYSIRNRALLKELALFNPDINVDRVRALGMVMLYREEKMILWQGETKKEEDNDREYLGNDPFFVQNYRNPWE